MPKKIYKKRKTKTSIPLIFAGVLVIGLAFVFSLHTLSDFGVESLDDHTMLFVNGTNWDPKLYAGVLTATDYRQAAQALQSAGYATDPDYASKIISVIETYNLEQYDHS